MNTVKRIILMLTGLFVMALAMAFLSAANLGISPVQSLAYVISNKFPDVISFGTASGVWNIILVGVQILLLRRKFKLWELFQIPLSLYFAVAVDLARKIVTLAPSSMPQRHNGGRCCHSRSRHIPYSRGQTRNELR